MKHHEEYGSTLPADDHIAREPFRSHEDDSNEATSDEVSLVAIIPELEEFWELRSSMTANVDVFRAHQGQQGKATTRRHMEDAQVSIHERSTAGMAELEPCNSATGREIKPGCSRAC